MEAKVKILFIDDDITFGRICTIILQEKGYEVFYQTTLNGAKACIAEALRISLYLMWRSEIRMALKSLQK